MDIFSAMAMLGMNLISFKKLPRLFKNRFFMINSEKLWKARIYLLKIMSLAKAKTASFFQFSFIGKVRTSFAKAKMPSFRKASRL